MYGYYLSSQVIGRGEYFSTHHTSRLVQAVGGNIAGHPVRSPVTGPHRHLDMDQSALSPLAASPHDAPATLPKIQT